MRELFPSDVSSDPRILCSVETHLFSVTWVSLGTVKRTIDRVFQVLYDVKIITAVLYSTVVCVHRHQLHAQHQPSRVRPILPETFLFTSHGSPGEREFADETATARGRRQHRAIYVVRPRRVMRETIIVCL